MPERLAVREDAGDAPDAEANPVGGIHLDGDGPTRLFLIRHGETGWNVEGRYQGQADPPLSEKGLRQARSLARRLRGRGLNVLYTSPLLRARITTGIVSDVLGAPVHVDARLMEIDLGRWQGRLATDIEREDPELFRRWRVEPWAVRPPEGESLEQVQERVYAAAGDILTRYRGQCVGVVTHRIPYLLLGIRYLGFPRDAITTFRVANACFEEIVNAEESAGAPRGRPPGARRGGAAASSRVP
jgi:broad specificity phosphatase PhoE